MKALVVSELSEDLSSARLGTIDLPPPAPNEMRVKIHASAVNFPDLLMVRGGYQFKPPLPFVPGMEVSGVVEALGAEVQDFAIGDAVVAGTRIGGFAEAINITAEQVRHKPDALDFNQAAAYTTAYLTAQVALIRRGAARADETLLVTGASGGVGLAAVDIAKMLGLRVFATASTSRKRDFLKAYGADEVLDPNANLRDTVKDLTDGQGVDIVYDPVGGDLFDEAVRCVAWGGRYLVIGFADGRIPSISVNMPLIKGYSIVGVRAGEYGRRDPQAGAENIAMIDEWARAGKLRPHIYRALPLAQARDALRLLETREVIGKVVVVP